MAKNERGWKVLPHAPIEKLSENLWRVQGDLEGMPLKRVMAVAKRADGVLVVHNAIPLDDASMKELDTWGKVGWIIVPNGYHRLDAPAFHERYPDAKVLAPRGAREKVEKVVPVSGTYEDFAPDSSVELVILDGTAECEGAMIVRAADGTSVVLTDTVFNMPHVPGFQGFVFRYLTGSSGGPRVSRLARMVVVKDKRAFRGALEKIAATPDLKRVLVAHHLTIDVEPARVLRDVAATL